MPINFPSSPTNGQEFTSGATTWAYDGTKWGLKSTAATTNDSLPIGAIMWFGNTTTTPPGYIAADGSAVSRSTYAALFAVIGTTHGSGNGSTTFNVPNVAATTGKYYIRYTTSLGTVTTTSLSTAPVGTMLDWPTTSSYPTGYLRADGTAVSRTSYADLFALIGTTYGVGDNSTTFNLPNLVSAGSGSPVKIIKASLGGIVEPSTIAHAAAHTEGGADPVTVTLNQVSNYQSNRNVIINGSMSVAQRATSVSGITTGGFRTADRWDSNLGGGAVGTWTCSVENDAPTGSGFRKSLKWLCTTAKTPLDAGSLHIVTQPIEGQNVQHFAKGTSSAKKFALSFWVKANVTGTYVAGLVDVDNSRDIYATYTISASATWEKKTIVFAADTTGAFDNNNEQSLQLRFFLAAGSTYSGGGALTTSWTGSPTLNTIAVGQVNVAAATNNYWQITGVQLEPEVVTPFEFEPYETTLRKCQRYYMRWTNHNGAGRIGFGIASSGTSVGAHLPYKVQPRIVTGTLSTNGTLIASDAVTGHTITAITRFDVVCSDVFYGLTATVGGGTLTQYRTYYLESSSGSTSTFIASDMEL